MRAGGYTVHQSLTAEAAAVLKMSLGLACRRGHAQVTPLHVAFTLLTSSSSSSSSTPSPLFADAAATASSDAYGLLRRACVKSHPAAVFSPVASHPLQCQALELCFNVALSRLATTSVVMGGPQCSPLSSPLSSSSAASSTSFSASLIQPSPTLSNALVAALKRAQANQRRGSIELQSQQTPPTQQQSSQSQQQPLLAIKVELDQLIVSILDDPSVSRVMREAGFSSAAVKRNLEEESAMLLLGLAHRGFSSASSPSMAAPPKLFSEPHIDFPTDTNGGGGGGSWPAQLLNQPGVSSSCKQEDVRAILEVMVRKQGTRTNPVVVGDSVSTAEAAVAELIKRLDGGEVPDELRLRGAHVLRLHLPYVHVRHMTRADVDASVADLRRRVDAAARAKAGAGLVIYVGDMRWTVDVEYDAVAGFSPVEHMVAELARLLGELRVAAHGPSWLMAAASYQTYMRWQRRRTPSVEATWALQPVIVPAGTGLALAPRATSFMTEGKITRLGHIPLLDHASGEEDGVPALCAVCANSYAKEASLVRAKAEGTTLALAYFPGWPQADEPQTSHKDELMELKRKWSRLCRSLHLRRYQLNDHPSNAPPTPWWLASLPNYQNKPRAEPKPSSAGPCLSLDTPIVHGTSDSPTTYEEAHCDRCEGLDAEPTALPLFGDLKRKAEGDLLPLGESQRRRDGSGGLDLNFCAVEEEDDGGDSEEETVPSDLTNECGSDGETGRRDDDSLDSHQ